MSAPANARRAFEDLFRDSAPADVCLVLVPPTTQLKPVEHKKKKKVSAEKSLRVRCQLSTRHIAGLLKSPQIGKYGTMTTNPSDIPQQTMKAIQKHEDGLCRCRSKGLNCGKQRQKVFNEALNRVEPVFVPWFTPEEIENYSDYARGEAGLGELKPYFEDIEKRVIQCALFLGWMRPIKGLIGSAPYPESEGETADIKRIIKSGGEFIGGHIESEGQNQSGSDKPLKTFDKSLPEPRRNRKRDDQAVSWFREEIERLRPAGPSNALGRVEDALDELFGGANG